MARGDKGVDGSGGSHLSELQQARITENYRAAKAILARKKRQLLPSSQVEGENRSPIKVPLYDARSGYVHFTCLLCIPFSSFNKLSMLCRLSFCPYHLLCVGDSFVVQECDSKEDMYVDYE
jgi:hypothetical protein